MADYAASIVVPASPANASYAIRKDMHIWWSHRVELDPAGAVIRFRNSHVRFEFDPDTDALSMRWPCVDAHMIIEDVADASEWEGTTLVWTIVPEGRGSRITLTHEGLNEGIACHDVCVRGWQYFFEGSLKAHLSGAEPTPETE
jgi:hypothetical protein